MSNEFRHINLAYLERITEGDHALKLDLLGTLTRQLQSEIPVLRAHCDAGRWQELAEVSHRLRGSLAFAGNDRMIGIAAEIERLAGQGVECERVPGLLAELEATVPKVLADLQVAAAAMTS